jgi:hypothetical protein
MGVRCEAEGAYDLRPGFGAFPAVTERQGFPMGVGCGSGFIAVHCSMGFANAFVICGDVSTPASLNKTRNDRAREAGKRAFRSMLLAFAVGFAAVAIAGFIATKEVVVVILVIFTFLGMAVCGWLGQRWLLRNMDDGG